MSPFQRVLAVAAVVLTLAACDPTEPEPSGAASTSASASSSSPAPATSAPSATETTPGAMTVQVYFGNTVLNPDAADCSLTFPVPREVPAVSDPAGTAEAALTELLTGPTPAEEAEGYTSWFSDVTEGDLIGVRVVDGTAYVNLADQRQTIPNASTSCGSAIYLSELGNTAQTAAGVPDVLYAFEGDPAAFWEWLQVGCDASNDNCDPAPFTGW